jgi:hypothetical protein
VQGHSRGAEMRRYKTPRRFFHQFFALWVLVVIDQALIESSGFSFGDFGLALFQNKKNSVRGRD